MGARAERSLLLNTRDHGLLGQRRPLTAVTVGTVGSSWLANRIVLSPASCCVPEMVPIRAGQHGGPFNVIFQCFKIPRLNIKNDDYIYCSMRAQKKKLIEICRIVA
jgi:hypothetical protein